MRQLWVEAYRPKTTEEYVFVDQAQQAQVEGWIRDGSIPHLLFWGPAGTGKTTLAKLLINQLAIDEYDVMWANGSKEARKIEWVDRLINFCQTMPFGKFKVVLIDEADFMNCFDKSQQLLIMRNNSITSESIENLLDTEFKVLSYNFDSNLIESTDATIIEQCEEDLYEVEFDDGSIITCTKDHQFFTVNGEEAFINIENYLFGINNIEVVGFVENKGTINESVHISSKKIKSIRFIGKKKVYDVVTNGQNQNFVLSNGVVAHNCTSVQPALRGLMEEYSQTVRFILTCNYPNKILPAIHSRCQGFRIAKTNLVEFTSRVAMVLVSENVNFDLDTLDTYVRATYPDMRKCLNLLQPNSQTGTLLAPSDADSSARDWRLDSVDLFKQGKPREARTLICQNTAAEDVEAKFTWLYDNLELWGSTPEQQDQAIIIIRNGAAKVPLMADQEINLSATLIELSNIT